MHALDEALARWSPGSLSFVLHIGAGSGAVLPLYATLRPRQALLVEGDPRHGASLRAAAAEYPFAEVLVRVISATGGELTWHRTTLPALDGPLDMQALQAYYPRLRLLERFAQASLPVSELLARPPPASAGPALLVLDVPGQEDALLAALGAQALQSFDACIVCGCNGLPGAAAARLAVERLQGGGAEVVWASGPSEPLWPLTVLRTPRGLARELKPTVDAEAANDAVASKQVDAAHAAELQRLNRENDALRDRLSATEAAQRERLQQLEAAHDRERLRHDALQQQLADAEAQIALLKDLLLRESQP